jgi:hypothetical protein
VLLNVVLGVPQATHSNRYSPEGNSQECPMSREDRCLVQVKKIDENLIRDLRDLNNNVPIRRGKRFTHYGKTLTSRHFLIGATIFVHLYDNELIGVIKLIYLADKASILTFLPKASHHDERPANTLMAKAVDVRIERNISQLIWTVQSRQ